MRRFLTTLMILLVVFLAGLSALVLLVNPNDFRAYMVKKVEARSGYQLRLDGPLRWHVWPQLSILSGRMSLTAPGASVPVVSADNMRLDVALWPLLSHQLQVRQVMLKGAVIQLTPQTEARQPADAPVEPKGSAPVDESERGWSFDIAQLQVADSLLVFQHDDDEQVTVRNINLRMEQNEKRQAQLELSARVNRDQRDLNFTLNADINAADYPHTLAASITHFGWQLQGADLPRQGVNGEATVQAQWQEEGKRLSFSGLQLSANDSKLVGEGSVALGDFPDWSLNLQSERLNLENLIAPDAVTSTAARQQGQQQATGVPRPMIASDDDSKDYARLRGFSGRLALAAKSLRWRGLEFTNVATQMRNDRGLLTVAQLEGQAGNGRLSLPGELDARGETPHASFKVLADNLDIATILRAFDYPVALTGKLSVQGAFSGDEIDARAFRERWEGSASVKMADTRMEGLNFQQLIQRAVTRSSGEVDAQPNDSNATTLQQFSALAALDHGELQLSEMQGHSSVLDLSGEGSLDLVRELCDARFKVRVTEGWQGDKQLVAWLRDTPIPLRVYGPWKQLNYNLQVDQLLRKHLQDEAKRRLNDWADRHKDSSKAKDVKEFLKKL